MTSKPIVLDRRLSIAELIGDLATIVGPDDEFVGRGAHAGMLSVMSQMAKAVEHETRAYVRHALADGATWQQIGDALGISRQAAHKRFSA